MIKGTWLIIKFAVDQKLHFTMSFSPACGNVRSVATACSCNIRECVPRPMNVLALCWKNLMRIYRNPGLLFFQFLLPTIQVALFCLAVGRNLEGVNVAYVDADRGERKLHCPGVVMSWCHTFFSKTYLYILRHAQDGDTTNLLAASSEVFGYNHVKRV